MALHRSIEIFTISRVEMNKAASFPARKSPGKMKFLKTGKASPFNRLCPASDLSSALKWIILILALSQPVKAAGPVAMDQNPTWPSIIPEPVHVELKSGRFHLTRTASVVADPPFENEAKLLAGWLRAATGYEIPLKKPGASQLDGFIRLSSDCSGTWYGKEGYHLIVQPRGVTVSADTPAGIFYGIQTLRQLLPPDILSIRRAARRDWMAPCMEITDWPQYPWRGFMLDVSRHFFDRQEVERVLDLMGLYKLNTFHWHLTDDQGWRIQIRQFPKLTSVGAWRHGVGFGLDPHSTASYDSRGRYGGFYTQEDIREVVAYAAARHITVVPEIEMPGHCSAALMAYPEMACPHAIVSLPERGGVFNAVFCAGNEKVFVFLNDILREVAGLFPGPFIHLGGDEVDGAAWLACPQCQALMRTDGMTSTGALQGWFMRRANHFVRTQGKRMVGWSETGGGTLAPDAVLMDWSGGGPQAAATGRDVVMSPEDYCYLDHYQSLRQNEEPRAIGGFLPLEKLYSFDPWPPKLNPSQRTHILGVQANLWTEYIPNLGQAEYMMFPRLEALAEVAWSPPSTRDWNGFVNRVKWNERRLDVLHVQFRPVGKPN